MAKLCNIGRRLSACLQTLDYDGKIDSMEDDDDGLPHYRVVSLHAGLLIIKPNH